MCQCKCAELVIVECKFTDQLEDMASHEELIAELQKLEKLSHAARLKHAKKRRLKQLKRYQEWLRFDRQSTGTGTVSRRKSPVAIGFEDSAVLNDLVSRNDLIGGKLLIVLGARLRMTS